MRFLPVLTVTVAFVVCGTVHGIWTNRWVSSAGPQEAAKGLLNVPMSIGEWDGQTVSVQEEQLKLAEIEGVLARRYVNRSTGSIVSVFIMCGPPGPIAVHPPDVCYQGAGYRQVGKTTEHEVLRDEKSKEVYSDWAVANFTVPNAPIPRYLRVFWAWSAGGRWTAPDQPRLAFGRQPALFKMYISRESSASNEPLTDDPCMEFAQVLLPEVQRTVFVVPEGNR